jgi:hypothetical protein
VFTRLVPAAALRESTRASPSTPFWFPCWFRLAAGFTALSFSRPAWRMDSSFWLRVIRAASSRENRVVKAAGS